MMAKILRDFDVVAIQEVVAKDPAGAKVVATIADELNRLGNQWDYRVSDPTQSPSSYISERYAFLWKRNKVRLLNRPYLDKDLASDIFREPYLAQFQLVEEGAHFYVVNFHSRSHKDAPEEEIRFFEHYQNRLGTDRVLIAGDFNLTEDHEVWSPLYKQGYQPSIRNSPTTLKRACQRGEYLNYAIDNIYYDVDAGEAIETGCVDLAGNCDGIPSARALSDHLPVFLVIDW